MYVCMYVCMYVRIYYKHYFHNKMGSHWKSGDGKRVKTCSGGGGGFRICIRKEVSLLPGARSSPTAAGSSGQGSRSLCIQSEAQ
mmetsp:Transcript_3342/g.5202  ORF Transcript_3342/g.5202 Transcript_3342/m.5202 type:complete len:84 (-) Transcript_3342:863-1114(-)